MMNEAVNTTEITTKEIIVKTITTVEDLFKKSFWGPKEYAMFSGQSIPVARAQLKSMQVALTGEKFNNLSNFKVAVSVILERTHIDYEFIVKTGGLKRVVA